MQETQPPRVQGLAIQQHELVRGIAADFAPRDPRPAAVLAVAQHRAADVAEMNANLVRAAGLRKDANDGEAGEPLADLVERLRRAARRIVAEDGHLLPLLRMHADGAIDEVPVAVRPARHNGEILLLDRAVLKLEGELVVRPIGAGDEDDAAGVAVEAMDDSRPQRAARDAQRGAEMELQRAGQGAGPMSPRRMDDHPRRLVDEHQLLVFVEDVQGDVFRTGRLPRNFRQDHGDALAFAQAVGGLAAAAVHLGPAGRNHLSQMTPAIVLKVDRQEGVQALVRFRRADHQLDGFGGKQRIGGSVHAPEAATSSPPEDWPPEASPGPRRPSIPFRPPT